MTSYRIKLRHHAFGTTVFMTEACTDHSALREAQRLLRSHGYGWTAAVLAGDRFVGERAWFQRRWSVS